MKNIFILFLCVFIWIFSSCSELPKVYIEQSIGSVGEESVKLSSPVISNLGNETYVRYDFEVDGKSDEYGIIDCLIVFPKDFDVTLVSELGVQKISLSINEDLTSFLTFYKTDSNTCCEFLIPQKENHIGYVSFKVKIANGLKKSSFPIDMKFQHLQKTNFMQSETFSNELEKNKSIGVAASVACAVKLDSDIVKLFRLQSIKEKYNVKEMLDSNTTFFWKLKWLIFD